MADRNASKTTTPNQPTPRQRAHRQPPPPTAADPAANRTHVNVKYLPTVGEPGGEAVLVDVADGARALAGGEQQQGRASLPVFPRAAHAARGVFLLLPTVMTRSIEKRGESTGWEDTCEVPGCWDPSLRGITAVVAATVGGY